MKSLVRWARAGPRRDRFAGSEALRSIRAGAAYSSLLARESSEKPGVRAACYNSRMFSRCIARFAGARHTRARSGIVSCALLVALGAHLATAQTAERTAQSWKLEAESAEAAGQWAEAAADYEKAIGLAPRDASLRAELGAALVKAGQYAGAIAAYQVALRISPGNLAAEILTRRRARSSGHTRSIRKRASRWRFWAIWISSCRRTTPR